MKTIDLRKIDTEKVSKRIYDEKKEQIIGNMLVIIELFDKAAINDLNELVNMYYNSEYYIAIVCLNQVTLTILMDSTIPSILRIHPDIQSGETFLVTKEVTTADRVDTSAKTVFLNASPVKGAKQV